MSKKPADQQSNHNAAAFASAEIYTDYGMYCWINAGDQKNRPWKGQYIDVIAAGNPDSNEQVWGIAFETTDSVSEDQAMSQWITYSQTFDHWYLAVPVNAENNATCLLAQYDINNCSVISWQKKEGEVFFFWGLPGLPSGPHKKHSMYQRISPRKAP